MLLCALWMGWASSPDTPSSRSSVDRSRKLADGDRASDDTPRRHLPTRTEVDALPVDAGPQWVCPLKFVDARTLLHLDTVPETAPSHARMSFSPPVLPAVGVELDNTTATFSGTDAARITSLPWAAGAASGHIAGLGDTMIAIDGDQCGLMVILVESGSSADGLRCPLSEDLSLADGHTMTLAAGPYEGRSVRTRIVDGDLLLRGVNEMGEAWLHLSEHPPVLVTWQDGECDPIEAPEAAVVEVEVTGSRAQSPVWVKGCGVTERLADGTTSIAFQVAAAPCALEAWRIDGALRALTPLVMIDPQPGRTTRVRLQLPESETGGIGISFRTGQDAVSVRGIHPNSPAWDAGLRSGDRIVAVDGEPTGGLQQHDFIALGTGPIGTEVSLTVEAEDGSVDELILERAALRN